MYTKDSIICLLFCIRISWSSQWALSQMPLFPVKQRVIRSLLMYWRKCTWIGKHLCVGCWCIYFVVLMSIRYSRKLWVSVCTEYWYSDVKKVPPFFHCEYILCVSSLTGIVISVQNNALLFFFSLRSIKLSLLMQKEMATYRHWSVSLWRDPDDVSHRQILSPDKTEWRLISATLCRWGCCFVADQLWLMTCIREEEEDWCTLWRRQDVMLTATGFADVESSVIRFLPCTAMHTARY